MAGRGLIKVHQRIKRIKRRGRRNEEMKEGRTQTILGKRQPRKEERKEATEEKG